MNSSTVKVDTTPSLMTTRGQASVYSTTTNSTSSLVNVTMETYLTTTETYLTTTDDTDFFGHLDLRDETTFVALIVMGVFVPAIFITMFLLIYFKRRKQVKERKAVMLLRNAQDMALDDYTCTIR
ncbi:uncharacterized protein LOC121373593 [Gigantopelta aegis]|uniref:uncharacterized protein LOC121373593 n=1 Tax=Gigantopelta aegis TaxID=1735272 RepID=UPI001B88CB1F|nr:uncharacterized protein LOC121373593 [Gigantopelta aegis]